VPEVATVVTETPAAAAVTPSPFAALGGLPRLGSFGAVATNVPDAPEAARALLTTRTGRSLALVLALLGAILLFLFVHRRVDRSDRKLVSARTGPDLARFR
jgi:hypothetical protein